MISRIRKLQQKTKENTQFLERNYLYGHIIPDFQSRLTLIEKIILERKIHIFIGTWNMNGQKPLNNLNGFLIPNDSEMIADLIIIGTQETCMYNISQWENNILNIIGSTHILRKRKQFGRLRLSLFLRRELIIFSSLSETNVILSSKYTILKTKGAISLGLIIFGSSFLFIMVHLTPHPKNTIKRIEEIKNIIRLLNVPKKLPLRNSFEDSTDNFDSVFLFGDLNFRLNKSREDVMNWISTSHFSKKTPINLNNDQLKILLDNQIILHKFNEAPITFPPTYKYNHGSQLLDSSGNYRTPAYTDRILYKSNIHFKNPNDKKKTQMKNEEIKCIIYDSTRSICSSDHKPVYGIFAVKIRAGMNTLHF
ncbi:PREDICTED: 72 kDa inositol polyphosphate 5-phosphatase [Ceratosolen solmsi marchali]|uniref:72 kDa inositol polyphosphate 5-phosphatase n=1 Tax=Ceratosolen solmsi marchali TaxID=326594 RepID=A0AAJ7DTC7_9HYME|nr:PREDICTED: 72 kDa inositol polyphosphate 5-phosphatase [Ceratosolen solmsi marchali]